MDSSIKHFKWIFFLCLICCTLIPLYYIIFHWSANSSIFLSDILFNILFTLLATGLNASSVFLFTKLYLHPRLPWHKNKTRRMLIELLCSNIISMLGSSIVFFIFLFTFGRESVHESHQTAFNIWFQVMVISIIINSLTVSIHEGRFLLREWMKTKVEAEQLRREKAESQYAALKNQVNPHFLFNSLNSLSSLIRTSPEKAIEFVDKFSKIYRYVLDVSDQLVVTVEEELKFLQSFYFLQTIRFGDNLRIHIHIEAQQLQKYIVPLSLQLLIENAIKHNEISTEHPLTINIGIENEFLIVSNNLQPKSFLEHSNGIGLKNITEQYHHYTDQTPTFGIENNAFVARIPLLEE